MTTTATTKTVTVIHCWSAPRSRSTALLYSFEARDDCDAIDEPLYREWLISRGDAVARPYTQEMITGVPPPDDVANKAAWERELLSLTQRIQQGAANKKKTVIFCKHMAKHCFLYDFEKECDAGNNNPDDNNITLIHKHLLLIRDPVQVLSSWNRSADVHGNIATPDEVGIVPLLSIYSSLQSRATATTSTTTSTATSTTDSSTVVLLDSDELAADPEGTLSNTCSDLGIPYQENMITWKSGPHACDGPWAKWWYENVHKSTGWHKATIDYKQYYPETTVTYRTLHPELLPALHASFPAYTFLQGLTKRSRERGGPPPYEDPRNAHILVYIGAKGVTQGCIVPRQMAAVNPWDSVVQGGDACWEGLRVYRGKIFSLDKHLQRLMKSAKALGFENNNNSMHTLPEIRHALFQVLAANGMRDGAHVRLTLTRGEKYTSSMNPKFNVYGTTLIILPEWKPTEGATTYDNTKGIKLISSSQRRNPPSTVDSKIHHNNLINNILPKLQANVAGVDDAIMLDLEGYVSGTNATNIFLVDDNGVLMTPSADHCLPGITRQTVLDLAQELSIPTCVRRLSLAEFYSAEEVFTTGTMGELTPVTWIDGRVIGSGGERGENTKRLQEAYKTLPERPGFATELPPYK
ncbi:acid aminotransferase-like protein 2 [Seminavis robusta]|uniref:Acid aminotransferase-like protein 2 n=1 Tax=Seminavis robusta TaxID=568900 RepID=A0A9N8ETY0_9STRA|nr:acid aminotransferase-like protein 2 [Seminavis robusta]|eukprot:Sro1866_g302500.1 acid aminotransferase-like protein 2 (636) ;mRNA; f:3651-5889